MNTQHLAIIAKSKRSTSHWLVIELSNEPINTQEEQKEVMEEGGRLKAQRLGCEPIERENELQTEKAVGGMQTEGEDIGKRKGERNRHKKAGLDTEVR